MPAAPHTQDHRAARFFAGAGGQEPLHEIHGERVGEKLADDLRRLEHQMFPLLDRAHRMMMRSLAYLDGRVRGGRQAP